MHELSSGVYAATLTPMHADLSCDTKELARHCLDLMQRGCKGVVLFGTSGEGCSFSTSERLKVLKKVIEEGVDPKKIILGNGGSNSAETIELILGAFQYNIFHFLIAPPSFFKNVSEEGVIGFYREILQRVSHPNLRVLLYHIPKYTQVPITAAIVDALLQEVPGTVIGLKDSEGNIPLAKQLLSKHPHFKLFVGKESIIAEMVKLGAVGAVSGIANVYPEWIHFLYTQEEKDRPENIKEIEAFLELLTNNPFIPACKALLEKQKGKSWHWVRPPLIPLKGK